MLNLPTDESDMYFIGLLLEGFFYGLYSGIFAMHLQYQAPNKDNNKTQKIIFCSICVLYALSVVLFASDIVDTIWPSLGRPMDSLLCISFIQTTSFACCDFIAQFILIYRCWIVWGRNIRVVIIPSILAFSFLVIWLVAFIVSGGIVTPYWAYGMTLSGLALSLTVNALVTGLIVFRIFKVFREVKATLDNKILGAAGGSKLRHVILVLIESGMALFSVQLSRLVVTVLAATVGSRGDLRVALVIIPIHEMLNGITPTIILVRTSMGLSFHDEKSLEEVAIGSLRVASNHPNSVPETGSVGIVGQDNRYGDDIDIQRSNDINVVER